MRCPRCDGKGTCYVLFPAPFAAGPTVPNMVEAAAESCREVAVPCDCCGGRRYITQHQTYRPHMHGLYEVQVAMEALGAKETEGEQ